MPLSTINSNSFSSTANTSVDNGTFNIDVTNNRVGINRSNPNVGFEVANSAWRLATYSGAGAYDGGLGGGFNPNNSIYSVYCRDRTDSYWNTLWIEANTISLKSGNGSYTAVQCDASGRVMMPQQPYARGSAGSNSGVGQVGIDTYITSRGGMVTTSNRFTVPVSGAYGVGYQHLGNSGSGACVVYIRKNGAKISGTLTQDVNSGNDSFGSSTIVELAANDYIDFYCQSGSTHGNSNYNSMWIWLIG